MRRTYKKLIALCAVLVFAVTLIPCEAFAQDPFTSIAIGGLTGTSGAGLFSSMAAASGINIGYNSTDPVDAVWNKLNPDHVYFSGEKHEATGIDEDVYDYINVDIGDWLDAQSDFIARFVTTYNVQDNDYGSTPSTAEFNGIPLYIDGGSGSYFSDIIDAGSIPKTTGFVLTLTGAGCRVVVTRTSANQVRIEYWYGGTLINTRNSYTLNDTSASIRLNKSSNNAKILLAPGTGLTGAFSNTIGTVTNNTSVSWTSDTVDTSVFDNYGSAKVKIPTGSLVTGWSVPDFMERLNQLWENGQESQIQIEDGDNPPVPPQPIPDTPLGDVPFDDWVDLWGQSIWDRLTRIQEKAELMVIGQSQGNDDLNDINDKSQDIIEGIDDVIGLNTEIEDDIDDLIIVNQGIGTDVGNIDDNVEDIEDEVIIIVDEMGNVIDVLEGIEAKEYANGQTLGDIDTDVGTITTTTTAISTELADQTETQEDILEAVEDMIPYIAPLPDIASDTETMVDILPDIKTATETSTQTLTDTLPDIKDATDTITETLPDIITEIQDATQTITDVIPQIDDICLNIDEAPLNDLDKGADRIPRFIAPYILDLRSALGIWHYVTEWIAQISTTFAFVTGCLVGTSIMTPIYATIAGYMCIRVYRRMCE